MIPMVASIAAVVTNFCLNLILIFGLLGAPRLGAVGAAIATVTSRFVELAVLAVWTHKNKLRCPFAVGAFRSLYIPGHLVREPNRAGLCGYQKNLECRNSLLIRSDSNGSPGQLSSSTI